MREHFNKEKNDIRRKHTELMAAFSELDPEPVFRFDETGNIIMTNQAGSDLCKSRYIINKPLASIIPEVAQIDLESCIEKDKTLNITSSINGRTFQFTIRGISRMQIGQIYGSDITELKQSEEKLKLALIKSEESENLKTEFLAQMSHEIRSPLTSVLGFNQIIKEQYIKKSTEDLTFAFDAIDNSAKRLIRTMDQLLNMSQLQTLTYKVSQEKFDLLKLLRNKINGYSKEVLEKELVLTLESDFEELKITNDVYAIEQIVQNILDNSIKYTHKGKISVYLRQDSKGKNILTISDTGIGMSDEYIKKLFTPFSQEIMGYNRPYEGNGLGLAISKRYSELNNIDIKVSSVKNAGTTVTLTFN